MPDHERSDLDVPHRLGRHDGEIRREVRRPEEIPASPERVGGERDDELALDQEQREVMSREIRSGDGHERKDEVGDERPIDPAELLRRRDRGEVGREDRRHEEDEPPEVEERDREVDGPLRRAGELGAQLAEQVLPGTGARKPSKLVDPRSTATKSSVPRMRSSPASPVNGQRTTTDPSRTANGAIRARSPKATAKPSPYRVHGSRPYTAIPASAQYV